MSLIDDLIQTGYLRTPEIIQAFKKIKREDFLWPGDEDKAEINSPLPIGYGQTISQPATVAFMLELLDPREGDKILDIGSGSGWACALLAQIVGEEGRVYGIERISELKKFAENNIRKYNFIENGVVEIFCSDGYQGLPTLAPFDKIMVAAASENIPKRLLAQLKIGGRLVIPIGKQHEMQEIVIITKSAKDKFKEKRYPGFIFVPLVSDN